MIESDYTSFFCEENIWRLAKKRVAEGTSVTELSILLISNDSRQVPLFSQRAGRPPDGLVVWDYHVILHQRTETEALIFDYDSRLPFPSPFALYCASTFPGPGRLPERYHIRTRIVPAADWLRDFHSDRSHMRDASGRPLTPFPRWPKICPATGQGVDLQAYLNLDLEFPGGGRVLSLNEIALDPFLNGFCEENA